MDSWVRLRNLQLPATCRPEHEVALGPPYDREQWPLDSPTVTRVQIDAEDNRRAPVGNMPEVSTSCKQLQTSRHHAASRSDGPSFNGQTYTHDASANGASNEAAFEAGKPVEAGGASFQNCTNFCRDLWSVQKENLKKRLRTAQARVDSYDKILVCISQKNIRSASRVLHRSLKRGDGLLTTLDKLVAAANGKGKERAQWNDYDLDLANLVCLEGGPRLLYALSKSEGMPSKTTLKRRKPIPELLPSIGTPSALEVDTNIASLFGKRGRKSSADPRVGLCLMIDDVALEEVSRYDTARNCVLGFCREHLGDAETSVNSEDDIKRLADDLVSGKIHHGKEGTVVALAPVTGKTCYYPTPLCATCTCKTEDGKTSASWIQLILDRWKANPDGEARHGPITAIATDGASQFRNEGASQSA